MGGRSSTGDRNSNMYKRIDSAPIGTVFKDFGGLTKQSDYSGYHGVHSANRLNTALRSDTVLSDSQKTQVRVMDSKMELTQSQIQVDREVSIKTLKDLGLPVNSISDIKGLSGSSFVDKGYGSSSYMPYETGTSYYTATSTPIHMKISVAKGTPAYLTSNTNEHEITLGRDLVYKINSVEEVSRTDHFGKKKTSLVMNIRVSRKRI